MRLPASRRLPALLMSAMLLCVFAGCRSGGSQASADLPQSRDNAGPLSYRISYQPPGPRNEPGFTADLTNTSDSGLRLRVNPDAFHAELRVIDARNVRVNVYDRDYRRLLLTSTWVEPEVELEAGASIRWRVPLSSLVMLGEEVVTHEWLIGKRVSSEMPVLIISGAGGNTALRSNTFVIPAAR